MTGAAVQPEPVLRFAGRRPEGDVTAPAPWHLAVRLRDYAVAQAFAVDKLERSRDRMSGSLYLIMTDRHGRRWHLRVSNHRRSLRTNHAIPHVDLVSLDGVSGIGVGRKLIDRIVAGSMPWFDPEATVRPLAQVRSGVRKRRR